MSAPSVCVIVHTILTFEQKRRLEASAAYRRLKEEDFIRVCILDGCFATEQKIKGDNNGRT